MTLARRRFLALAAIGAPLALVGIDAARAAVCYDPAALPLSQKNRRRSLGYLEVAGDAGRRCQGCAFFTARDGDCGTCALLGGPVNAGASCGSFAPRGK